MRSHCPRIHDDLQRGFTVNENLTQTGRRVVADHRRKKNEPPWDGAPTTSTTSTTSSKTKKQQRTGWVGIPHLSTLFDTPRFFDGFRGGVDRVGQSPRRAAPGGGYHPFSPLLGVRNAT